ncbi:hypothetical protein SAMN05421858_3616 [Haladaptatus litoreus]|uniref:D-isomer specific 2-hydroxyacid dehydrogenase, catalytic domain n=1 Tax=Haladaptatus litoreus TaxID=553468 RepID=A0A1N7DH05_9EURY|nr:hypothetical protein SAMN05421858_3616 [Haladaptatus litoreus]
MNDDRTDVLVLRSDTHGLPAAEYAAILDNQLPNLCVRCAQTPSQEREFISDAKIVSSVRIDENLLEYAENLQLFAGVAAGYNHLPLQTLADMGVVLTSPHHKRRGFLEEDITVARFLGNEGRFRVFPHRLPPNYDRGCALQCV